MPISPWYVGMTGQSFTIYCRDDSGEPLPLYNANGSSISANQLSLILKTQSGAESYGGGLFAVVDANNGIVKYQPAASDVQTARTVSIIVQIDMTNGPIFSDVDTWVIQDR